MKEHIILLPLQQITWKTGRTLRFWRETVPLWRRSHRLWWVRVTVHPRTQGAPAVPEHQGISADWQTHLLLTPGSDGTPRAEVTLWLWFLGGMTVCLLTTFPSCIVYLARDRTLAQGPIPQRILKLRSSYLPLICIRKVKILLTFLMQIRGS